MDYLYENLGDDRFQEFCQSLILKEFPNTQILPTRQPDGGRDSFTYFTDNKGFCVFQVKYVKSPGTISEPHKWLLEVIKAESPKIKALIPRGASKYILITNIKGTSHLDNGSIDRLQTVLDKNIPIPSICWWRDDLSRRFENNNDLKWSYTELINGKDILNIALFNNLNEDRQRRENVIRAYLVDQYRLDDQVKFRQVDLENRLLNLFTDVPIRLKKYDLKNKVLKRKLEKVYSRPVIFNEETFILEDNSEMGAAEFLLNSEVQNNIEKILLEGGPGQGKSTISQYISQVHRIHLLNKNDDLALINGKVKNIQIRLPFKIDLRHVATWVENKNPYTTKLSEDVFIKIWQKSLESFLLGHILQHSQLDGFDRNDLIAICKLSPILFVFDGFDEIANLNIREEVIDLINRGVERIAENALSLQVIVTSRPAAFIDSKGFSDYNYPHFELTEITPKITTEYVDRWIKASRLDIREATEIRRLVDEKLKMPHLRDLAKSPMQLAIFISLLRKKGESLPNKRTALYDNYIELFFDRESEKSKTIRDNRDLIIDIHEYLGWILHSEAELYQNSGSIEINVLKSRLREYLEKEGHKTDITDELFDVVKERVCALASRVQGTFEFEVQPLREYFCAKYLYKTSPYSPIGNEKSGTKPERFEAIACNYYWQNTVRFFAGCFDKGELPMLIQKLKELENHSTLKYTNYPRILTSQILSDWVFTQYPLLLKEVVKIIINGVNIGGVLNQDQTRFSSNEPIILPLECGRKELFDECFNQLKSFPLNDYANELIGIIKNNSCNTIVEWTNVAETLFGDQLTVWFEYANKLEILYKIHENILVDLLKLETGSSLTKKLQILITAGKIDFINSHQKFKKITFQAILENSILFGFKHQTLNINSLRFLSISLGISSLTSVINGDDFDRPYFQIANRKYHNYYNEIETFEKVSNFEINDLIDDKINQFKEGVKDCFILSTQTWKTSSRPWNTLIEVGKNIFDDHWIFSVIAVTAAGIRSKEERFEDCEGFDDKKYTICERVRSARIRSGNIKFWGKEFISDGYKDLKLLTFLTWATSKTIITLLPTLISVVDTLSFEELKKIQLALKKTGPLSYFLSSQQKAVEIAFETANVTENLKYLISFRMGDEVRRKFIFELTDDDDDSMQIIINLRLEYLVDQYLSEPANIDLLEAIKKTYQKLIRFSNRYSLYNHAHQLDRVQIPLKIAENIMADCKSYPRIIASLAEKICRSIAFRNITPVGKIAAANNWFK